LQHGRLAGPVRADDADELALGGRQARAVQDVDARQVARHHVVELDDVRGGRLLGGGRGGGLGGAQRASSSGWASASASMAASISSAPSASARPSALSSPSWRPVTTPRSTSWWAPR